MRNETDELFVFRRFLMDEDAGLLQRVQEAAVEKLQTLFPGHRLVVYDALTVGIDTDSPMSETGVDTYETGLVDGEVPAMRNTRDGHVITLRV